MLSVGRSIYSLTRLGLTLFTKSFYSKHSTPHISKQRLPFDLSLYLVADRPSFPDENEFFSKIMKSVKGGVSCVQLRDHKNDFATILKTATRLKKMLEDEGIPLFINTSKLIEVVQAIDAHGVYLEESLSASETREILGQKIILGIPVKTMDDVITAEQTRTIDYISVKISPSKRTCPINNQVWGMEGLIKIREISSHRIVAIGGLTLECAESIYKELNLNDGIAIAGGLMGENDPYDTAKKIQIIRQSIKT